MLQFVLVLLALGSPELELALQMCLTSAEWRGRISSVNPIAIIAMLFLVKPRKLLTFFAVRAHCCLMLNLLSTRCFFVKLLSNWMAPTAYWYTGLFLSRCRTVILLSQNMRYLSAQFPSE